MFINGFPGPKCFRDFRETRPCPWYNLCTFGISKYYPILHNVFLLLGLSMLVLVLFFLRVLFPAPTFLPSSETQGQLVGTTGFSWAKVYNKSGRAPGHLLLPSEFQKRLKSRLSAKRNSRATLMSSYTRLFSSSIAVVAWPVQREHFWGELQKK